MEQSRIENLQWHQRVPSLLSRRAFQPHPEGDIMTKMLYVAEIIHSYLCMLQYYSKIGDTTAVEMLNRNTVTL